MTAPSVTVQFALLCDDVRREDNGKLIAIGIYAQDIRVKELPATLRLGLLIGLDVPAPTDTEIALEFHLDKDRLAQGGAKLSIVAAGRPLINFPPIALKFEKEGEILVRMKPEHSDWMTVWQGLLIHHQA